MKKCPKCGVPTYFWEDDDLKACPLCLSFFDDESENAFWKEHERDQQLTLDKLEIVFGKEYADEMRRKAAAGAMVSFALGPYENLSLDELRKLFRRK